jgi:hypothetical protein
MIPEDKYAGHFDRKGKEIAVGTFVLMAQADGWIDPTTKAVVIALLVDDLVEVQSEFGIYDIKSKFCEAYSAG